MEHQLLDCSSIPTDLTIRVGNKDFKVHRIIMASRSPYFNKMLTGPFKETAMSTISLPDEDPQIFEEFLNLVYTRSHTSSPALMAVVNLYGVVGITLDMLHKQFEVPAEQLGEYVEAIIGMYPTPLPQKVIDIIASKVTSVEHRLQVPSHIEEDLLMSKKMLYYSTGSRWVEQLGTYIMNAQKEKRKGHKATYRLDTFEQDYEVHIKAYGPSDALLKMRGIARIKDVKEVKEAQKLFDEGLDQPTLKLMKNGKQVQTKHPRIVASLPNLPKGARYVLYRECKEYNQYDVVISRPSMKQFDELNDDYIGFLWSLTDENGIGEDDLSAFFSEETLSCYNRYNLAKYDTRGSRCIAEHKSQTIDVTQTDEPNIFRDELGYAISVLAAGPTVIGKCGPDSVTINPLTDTDNAIILEKYGFILSADTQ